MTPYVLSLEKYSQWCDDVVHTHGVNNAFSLYAHILLRGGDVTVFTKDSILVWEGRNRTIVKAASNFSSFITEPLVVC